MEKVKGKRKEDGKGERRRKREGKGMEDSLRKVGRTD